MNKTTLNIINSQFTINSRLTYSDVSGTKPEEAHGLLMNARFIQGIFDDKVDLSGSPDLARQASGGLPVGSSGGK